MRNGLAQRRAATLAKELARWPSLSLAWRPNWLSGRVQAGRIRRRMPGRHDGAVPEIGCASASGVATRRSHEESAISGVSAKDQGCRTSRPVRHAGQPSSRRAHGVMVVDGASGIGAPSRSRHSANRVARARLARKP